MSTFLYTCRGKFLGEFRSPSDFPFSDIWLCVHCGGDVAKRLNTSGPQLPIFVFHPLTCTSCAKDVAHPPEITSFRIPAEQHWTPIEILTEEFLHNYGVMQAYERSSHSRS